MDAGINQWIHDPVIARLTFAVAAVVVIIIAVKALKTAVGRLLKDTGTRYRARKVIVFAGYVLAILFIAAIFSDRLGNLTVALGIAGAGIAFALQEVIASFAGWLAISFGGFYRTGDRVSLGGI